MRAVAPLAVQVAAVLQPSEAVPSASATLPAVPLRLIGVGSVKSGAGSGAPVVPPDSCTRNRCPGARLTSGSSVSWPELAPRFPVPVALAYWSERPPSGTGASPRL